MNPEKLEVLTSQKLHRDWSPEILLKELLGTCSPMPKIIHRPKKMET